MIAKLWLRATLAATLVLLAAAALPGRAAAAAAPPPGVSPVLQRGPQNVTADALPTVQIDGVVWTELTVGNTVFAGGSFANARPAGAAPGTQLTPRANLLSFDIATGALNTSFAPSLNGEVQALAVSPDGKRLYVGGAFTTANGVNRFRIAAYNIATGQLDTTWAPALNAEVNTIAVSNNAVYVGGNFSTANNVARGGHLAAFDPVTGALLGWAPTADTIVQALVVTPDQSRVIVGGGFQHVNGASAIGLAALDANNGTMLPWAANQVVQDGGANAAILSLSTDGTAIYSTGYVFGADGNFEGVMSADPNSGTINWLADCHGDSYGAFSTNGAVYVASHFHYCANIGGFPDTNPRSVWHRAGAFTTQATGTVTQNGQIGGGYGNFAGQPSPSLINWVPDMDIGTYTGQSQGPWSVGGNDKYVVFGGEFPRVNGTAQQGLVRFAVPSLAPKAQGPRVSAASFVRSATPLSGTAVRVAWQSNWDRDDQDLLYTVRRNGAVVYTTHFTSQFWYRPMIGFTDTGLSPNTSYTYRISAADPDGTTAFADNITVTTPSSGTDPSAGAYPQDVLNAGATNYWRLDGRAPAGTDFDLASFNDLALRGTTATTAGAVIGDADPALTFNGSTSTYANSTGPAITGPDTFSIAAWVKTTSSSGGKIVGFGDAQTGNSGNYDRQLYLDNSGRIYFGVFNNATFTINTGSKTYRDGNWHQVVGTMSNAGMALYVDGALVGTNTGTTIGQFYRGYWRVGGDNLTGWPGTHTSNYLSGSIDDVAIYPSPLSLSQVRQQYLDSGRSVAGFGLPTAAFTATPTGLSVNLDGSGSSDSDGTITSYAWNFGDGASGTGVSPSHTYPASGTYTVKLTVTDNNGGTGTVSHDVTVQGPNQLPHAAFTSSVTGAAASFDSSGSNDPDGTIQSYAWDFGDGTNGSAANPSHTYATSGTFHVQLTVTDDRGGTDSVTHDVTVATQPPHAAFSSAVALLTASFDGSASTSVGTTITSYDWDFGDGTTHGSGVTANHVYATPGTYQVTLKITDSTNQTDSVTHSVTVTNVVAADTFTRTVTGGWGTADTGGAWSRTGGSANFSVDGSRAQVTLATASVSPNATLDGVSATDVNMVADVSLNKVPTGDSAYAILVARHTATADVRLKLRIMPGGVVHLAWSTVSGGKEVVGGERNISGLTYAAGDTLRLRLRLVGTSLSGTVWNPSTGNEPASPQTTATLGTSGTAAVSGPGSVGLYSGLAAAATNAPIAVRYDNLSVTNLGVAPPPAPARKVMVIVEENHSQTQAINSMPHLASWASTYGQATNYVAVTHPSLPNYLAIAGGSDFGVADDDAPSAHALGGDSVFDQTLNLGLRAKTYAEGMTGNCTLGSSGLYAVKHNAWAYFNDTAQRTNCNGNDVPLGTTSAGNLVTDINAGNLPNTGMMIPDLCNDAHDCPLSTADDWLGQWVPKLMAGPDYTSGNLTIVVTFDEDDSASGNNVAFVVIDPRLNGKTVTGAANHYSLTRWLDTNAGAPLLRNAATAPDLKAAFGL